MTIYAVYQNLTNPNHIIISTLKSPSSAPWIISETIMVDFTKKDERGETKIMFERIGNPYEANTFEQAAKEWKNHVFRVLPIAAKLGG